MKGGRRRFPRIGILAFLPGVAAGRWIEVGLSDHWRHPVGVFDDDGADVYFWQEIADVDCSEEYDGAVLGGFGMGE